MTSHPQRPTYNEVRALLKSYEGLIVHFSTSPSMHADPNGCYPDDLHTALTSACCRNGGLSCSVVTPGDRFDGDTPFVPGCIGIILDPRSDQSIISCSTGDGGDCRDPRSCTVIGDLQNVDISVEKLEETICNRVGYNNWLVKNYDVLGILALPPFRVEIFKEFEYYGRVKVSSCIGLSQIASEFPCSPIYKVSDSRYWEFRNGHLVPREYDEIWPPVREALSNKPE